MLGKLMNDFGFVVQTSVTLSVITATPRAARPLARMAALQLVGIARYSSSSRLALHTMERTARDVQLPFLG
jgi:hypothetical protein